MIESYADLAARVLGRPPRLGSTRLVAVDGPSGAGKSVFADRLAGAIAVVDPDVGRPPVVHTDDLLDGWADQFTFWPRLEAWVLAPLRAGRPGRYRRYDWLSARFDPEWITVDPAPVVLLEGVSSARAAVRPELTLAVFVAVAYPTGLARAVARDGVALRSYLERWQRGEERHFATDATAHHADLVVDGAPAVPHDPATRYVRLR